MKLVALLAFSAILVGIANGECPGMDDLPVMYNADTFMCARFYYGWGHDLAVSGCNGCSLQDHADIPHGLDQEAGDGYIYPMGSAMVNAGCTLYVFHDHNFGGSYDRYDGPTIVSTIHSGGGSVTDGCANGHPSFQCRCSMSPVSCQPTDDWAVVLRCDATGAIEPSNCNYYKIIGTIFGQSFSESASVSVTVEEKLSVDFFEIFSASVGISTTTGYNWKGTSSVTKSTKEQFTVIATAPPGLILTIEQAVGTCGDSVARTEMFRIRHTDAKGNVVNTKF
jgi:hypothetical protein